MNPGRQDPPDIDFPWDERDRVLDWIMARYGARSTAMVANQNMVGVKGALREVAKVFGMPEMEIKDVSAKIGRQAALVGGQITTREWKRYAPVKNCLGMGPTSEARSSPLAVSP